MNTAYRQVHSIQLAGAANTTVALETIITVNELNVTGVYVLNSNGGIDAVAWEFKRTIDYGVTVDPIETGAYTPILATGTVDADKEEKIVGDLVLIPASTTPQVTHSIKLTNPHATTTIIVRLIVEGWYDDVLRTNVNQFVATP